MRKRKIGYFELGIQESFGSNLIAFRALTFMFFDFCVYRSPRATT